MPLQGWGSCLGGFLERHAPLSAARERGGPLPSIDVADALLDERRELDASNRSAANVAVPMR